MSQIAQTILDQLGGRRFLAMTGARSLTAGENNLGFRLPARLTKNGGSGMRIELNAHDLYDLKLFKIVNLDVRTIEERSMVGAENLQSVFTEMTGLDTSLGQAA